jgi:alpha-glucosidase
MRRRARARFTPMEEVLATRPAGPGTLDVDLGEARVRVALARDGSLRLRAASGPELPPDLEPALGRLPWSAANAQPFRVEPSATALAVDGPEGSLRVEVDERPFGVRVLARGGRQIARLLELGFGRDGAVRIALAAAPEERFLGFGASTGPLDRRGLRLVLRGRASPVRERAGALPLAIPFFLRLAQAGGETRADGFWLDTAASAHFDVCASDPGRVGIETGARGLDLTLFPGPRPADVLRRFTARTGRPPRPPRWALGHHLARRGTRSAAALRRLAAEARRLGLPADALHLDLEAGEAGRSFSLDPTRFDDPFALARALARDGFALVASVDPRLRVDPHWKTFREGAERGLLVRDEEGRPYKLRGRAGDAALPDLARPEARAWWGEQLRGLLDAGVSGVRLLAAPDDVGRGRRERPTALGVGRRRKAPRGLLADPADPEQRVAHEWVCNAQAQLACRATREGLERLAPERRAWVLASAGTAGIAGFATAHLGELPSGWAQLRLSMQLLLSLSVSGVPLCGADLGGSRGACSGELLARSVQLGALAPFARTHTTRLAAWQRRRLGARVGSIVRTALELRMRLLPYLYALCVEAEASGAPIWRPLAFDHADDPHAAAVDDAFLLGPALLVAPVLERGARARDVYLPAGTWFALDDGARWIGPRTVRVAAPLERIPIFARGGSVVPMQGAVQHTGEPPAEPCVLAVFPGGDGAAVWVEDDGESVAYRDGAEARVALRLRGRSGGRMRLEVGRRSGPPLPAPRPVRAVVHGCAPPSAVWLDAVRVDGGAEADGATPSWSWEAGVLHVRWIDDGSARVLEVEPPP